MRASVSKPTGKRDNYPPPPSLYPRKLHTSKVIHKKPLAEYEVRSWSSHGMQVV